MLDAISITPHLIVVERDDTLLTSGVIAVLTGNGFNVRVVDPDCADPPRPAESGLATVLITRARDNHPIDRIAARYGIPRIVLLTDEPEHEVLDREVDKGVVSTLAGDASDELCVLVVLGAINNSTVLHDDAARQLVTNSVPGRSVELSDEDERLLGLVSRGATARAMSTELGYSERTIYRRLRGLRDRLMVSTLPEAVDVANRRRKELNGKFPSPTIRARIAPCVEYPN